MRPFAALLTCLTIAACAAAGSGPGSGTLTFTPIFPQRGQADCADSLPATRICRVRVERSAAELRTRLAAGTAIWREGDRLAFVWQGEAEAVDLSGGIQYPMTRLPGTDLWTITVRVPEADRAVVSYMFIPMTPGAEPPRRFTSRVWRGPRATPARDTATVLQGRLFTDTLASDLLPAPRPVTVYLPPERGGAPIAGVVYAGDGGGVNSLARILDTLVTSGRLPRIMLVGLHSDPTPPSASTPDGRALEYLIGFGDTTRFTGHEHWFLDEVMPWAERTLGAPAERERRATFGFSNSAAFAIEMALRHPDRFGYALAFSPAGRNAELDAAPDPAPAFYLLGGLYEPSFHAKALAWGRVFAAHGIRHQVVEVPAGHDWEQWETSFPDALAWAFGGAP